MSVLTQKLCIAPPESADSITRLSINENEKTLWLCAVSVSEENIDREISWKRDCV